MALAIVLAAIAVFDFASGQVCQDNPDFRDPQGYSCGDWLGFLCEWAADFGHSESEYGELLTNCCKTCEFNEQNLKHPPEGCQDDFGFADEQGNKCEEWKDYSCYQGVRFYGLSRAGQQELLTKCRRSCGSCYYGKDVKKTVITPMPKDGVTPSPTKAFGTGARKPRLGQWLSYKTGTSEKQAVEWFEMNTERDTWVLTGSKSGRNEYTYYPDKLTLVHKKYPTIKAVVQKNGDLIWSHGYVSSLVFPSCKPGWRPGNKYNPSRWQSFVTGKSMKDPVETFTLTIDGNVLTTVGTHSNVNKFTVAGDTITHTTNPAIIGYLSGNGDIVWSHGYTSRYMPDVRGYYYSYAEKADESLALAEFELMPTSPETGGWKSFSVMHSTLTAGSHEWQQYGRTLKAAGGDVYAHVRCDATLVWSNGVFSEKLALEGGLRLWTPYVTTKTGDGSFVENLSFTEAAPNTGATVQSTGDVSKTNLFSEYGRVLIALKDPRFWGVITKNDEIVWNHGYTSRINTPQPTSQVTQKPTSPKLRTETPTAPLTSSPTVDDWTPDTPEGYNAIKGRYCHSYGYRGNASIAPKFSDAIQICNEDPLCKAVARFEKGTRDWWNLCGTEGYGLAVYSCLDGCTVWEKETTPEPTGKPTVLPPSAKPTLPPNTASPTTPLPLPDTPEGYAVHDGKYCHSYGYRGNKSVAPTFAEAVAICNADAKCMGVAKYTYLPTTFWNLCGVEGFGLGRYDCGDACTVWEKEIKTPSPTVPLTSSPTVPLTSSPTNAAVQTETPTTSAPSAEPIVTTSPSVPANPCATKDVEVQENFDADSFFQGKWYLQQMLINEQWPETENDCVTVNYTPMLTGVGADINVDVEHVFRMAIGYNAGADRKSDMTMCVRGSDPGSPAKMLVGPCGIPRFVSQKGETVGDFWVVLHQEVNMKGKNMGYAVVAGGPPVVETKKGGCTSPKGPLATGLWVFTRSQKRNYDIVDLAMRKTEIAGYEISEMKMVKQDPKICSA